MLFASKRTTPIPCPHCGKPAKLHHGYMMEFAPAIRQTSKVSGVYVSNYRPLIEKRTFTVHWIECKSDPFPAFVVDEQCKHCPPVLKA